jgi:hypothetical protein
MPTYTITAPNGNQLEVTGDHVPTEAELRQIYAAAGIDRGTATTSKASSGLDRLLGLLPAAGGMVGGAAGGIPGAALGGAAGAGYRQLGAHLTELPGAAMDVTRNLVRQPGATLRGAVEGAGQGAKDAGIEAALQSLYELGGRAVTAGLSTAGRAVYRGYLKPSLSKPLLAKASEIVETGIREAIPVTDAGAAKADRLIGELNGEVDRILQNAKGDVNLSDVANQVRAFARRKYYKPGQPMADYEAAMKVADELDQHPSIVNPMAPTSPAMATPTAANDIKRGLDETVGASNFGMERGATKTAQKVARRGVRQQIEAVAPEVAPLNARQSRLLDLAQTLNRAVGREGNRNQLFGMPALAAGASAATEFAHGTSAYGSLAMGLAARVGLSPAAATRAAILAAKMGDQVPGTAVADVARAAVEAVRLSESE